MLQSNAYHPENSQQNCDFVKHLVNKNGILQQTIPLEIFDNAVKKMQSGIKPAYNCDNEFQI